MGLPASRLSPFYRGEGGGPSTDYSQPPRLCQGSPGAAPPPAASSRSQCPPPPLVPHLDRPRRPGRPQRAPAGSGAGRPAGGAPGPPCSFPAGRGPPAAGVAPLGGVRGGRNRHPSLAQGKVALPALARKHRGGRDQWPPPPEEPGGADRHRASHPKARPLAAAANSRTHFTDEETGVTPLQVAGALWAWSLGLPAPSVRHAGRWTGPRIRAAQVDPGARPCSLARCIPLNWGGPGLVSLRAAPGPRQRPWGRGPR